MLGVDKEPFAHTTARGVEYAWVFAGRENAKISASVGGFIAEVE